MKIRIKDLEPNPFRDMKNYPINPEKIESLAKSINQTGFWDNILGRLSEKAQLTGWDDERNPIGTFDKNHKAIEISEGGRPVEWTLEKGKVEIAYGHHRLVVLQRTFKPDHIVDIPIKDLDDSTMIRIMANENDESWAITPGIIDETVRVTHEYLEKHFSLGKNAEGKMIFKDLPKPKAQQWSIVANQISSWLGGNWTVKRVYYSLERLGLIEEGRLDKKAVESMPQDTYARRFTKAIKDFKPEPEIQRRAAQKIREREDYSEEGIESAIIEEQFPTKKPKEIKISELKKLMIEATQLANSLKGKIETLTGRMKEFYPEISEEKEGLGRTLEYLGATIQYFIKIYKEQKDATKKGLLKS